MKYLDELKRRQVAGEYFAPTGLYEYTKNLPFLGSVNSNIKTLVAGEWTEIVIVYEVGASGLADGAWIKGTFKFYSDWALFQTSDPSADNYVSAEYTANSLLPGQTPATVQSLRVRFDQKGHERPFQKAVIVDIQDGYLNPGDYITIRLGDRRFGGKGTRAQTFVESGFRWRFYIDPVGTSRFAPIRPDISWDIIAGPVKKLDIVLPRLVRPDQAFAIHAHAEDKWGNVTRATPGLTMSLSIRQTAKPEWPQYQRQIDVASGKWSNTIFENIKLGNGDYIVEVKLSISDGAVITSNETYLTVDFGLDIPKVLFGDLHVHSDDTVGTESSVYNFSYGREIAGLDVLGYTANDFQITQQRWEATTKLIQSLNEPGKFVIFPGTEWCGNSAAGGDHNVVFLADPATSPPEFPYDRHGNVARSFEWSEDGPEDLVPGAWPLDEVYATYAHDAENTLLIPHVGGRRCNLAWHHPKLERLVEIGSAWGQFEWLLRDAVRRGWKLGVCANSDEHRGRCGGGVPGTAVFGTRGGLTGILSPKLDRKSIANTLRARHTFATTGQRLVGLVSAKETNAIQGDEVEQSAQSPLVLDYHFLGNRGFSTIEAFDASGLIWQRHFWSESDKPATVLRVTWGGARLFDRYREAVWSGNIEIAGSATIDKIESFGGLDDNPEDQLIRTSDRSVSFNSRTSGDVDGVNIFFADPLSEISITASGTIGGYVKVGDALAGNPHKAQPSFDIKASWDEASKLGGKQIDIGGSAEAFVRVEAIPDIELPRRVQGTVSFGGEAGQERAIYFVGREWSGAKVVTSPIFVKYV